MITGLRLKVEGVNERGESVSMGLVPGGSGVEAFVHQLEGALNTFYAKEKMYGGAWRQQGWMGNLARIMSKTARLKNMLWRGEELTDEQETVNDTLQDMINLCVFALLNRGQRNRWGSGPEEF